MVIISKSDRRFACIFCQGARAKFTIAYHPHKRDICHVCHSCLLSLQAAIELARKPASPPLKGTKDSGTVRAYDIAFFWENSPYMMHETVEAISKDEAIQTFMDKHPDAKTYAISLKEQC